MGLHECSGAACPSRHCSLPRTCCFSSHFVLELFLLVSRAVGSLGPQFGATNCRFGSVTALLLALPPKTTILRYQR